jgi:DNA repair protein RecO (recombination protein O)
MPLRTTDAVVIGGYDLAEADRIIVFYTHAAGKVRAVAEGARRIRSRFGGALQLFTQGRLVYFERANRTLHKVNEFAVADSHQALREDLDRIALGSTLVEAVALGVADEQPSPALYRLLAEGLRLVEEAERPTLVLHGFTLHLLRLLGYLPELGACVACRAHLPPRPPIALSPARGGLLCPACRSRAPDARGLSLEALGFLRGASGASLRLMGRVDLTPGVEREVGEALLGFLQYVLGRPLKSADFLGRLAGR